MRQKFLFYFYILLDPRILGSFIYRDLKFPYEPIWIGKGSSGDRPKAHIRDSKDLKNNRRIHCKIRKIFKDSGKDPVILKISCDSENEALYNEIDFINVIGRADNGDEGPLCNHTDGGDGATGLITSEKAKEKLRLANLGKKRSKESKEKSSASLRLFYAKERAAGIIRRASVKTKQRQRRSALNRFNGVRGAKEKRKISVALIKKYSDPKEIKKLSYSHRGHRPSKATLLIMSKAQIKSYLNNPSRVKKQRKSQKKRWSDPTQRKKQSLTIKKSWLARRLNRR